jgi:arsenical pump membrane protein
MTFPICAIWILSLLSLLGMLLRPRGIAEAWWVCGGAVLLVGLGLLPVAQALHAVGEGFDVYLFLTGMMILSELAREKGVFDWIAGLAARHAHGSPRRLFLLIYLAGTVVTAFLSNDATAVVLTPAVLTIVRRLRVEPAPHLLVCAFIANAASFLLPISNPANLVVFGRQMPALGPWLAIFFAPSVASIVVTLACLYFLTRGELRGEIAQAPRDERLSLDGRLALGGLVLSAIALATASACGWPLGLPTCVAALVATVVVGLRDFDIAGRVARGVAWSVLPLVAGLFVIVAALQATGLLQGAARGLEWAQRLGPVASHMITGFFVALVCNGMNNLPVGLLSGAALRAAAEQGGVAHAVLIGVDLGPNLSVTGSLATILWLIALRREKVEITAWQFLKIGLVTMPLALAASLLALGFR